MKIKYFLTWNKPNTIPFQGATAFFHFSHSLNIIDMVKTTISLHRKTVLTPEDSFIKEITLIGNSATVVMHESTTGYLYEVTDYVKKKLISTCRNKESLGTMYNMFLRGKSIGKIVANEEPRI